MILEIMHDDYPEVLNLSDHYETPEYSICSGNDCAGLLVPSFRWESMTDDEKAESRSEGFVHAHSNILCRTCYGRNRRTADPEWNRRKAESMRKSRAKKKALAAQAATLGKKIAA